MKKWKKYAGCLLALVLCLSLTACGGNSDNDNVDSAESVENTVSDTVESSAEETSASTVTEESSDAPAETADNDASAETADDDAPTTLFDTSNLGDPVEYDYSAYLGRWNGTDGTTITVEEDNGQGTPFTMLNRYGEPYTSGVFRYVEEYGYVYVIDDLDGMDSKCWLDEKGRLEIPGFFSTYSKVTGDASDYIVIYGAWFLDGDMYAAKCVEFDSSGEMWSLYERDENGLLQGSDEGYLVEIGNNRYQAISYWDENQTYDCYFENESTLYWGSEENGYEVYG